MWLRASLRRIVNTQVVSPTQHSHRLSGNRIPHDFSEPATVHESKVFWFEDGPWGGVRIPVSYEVYYQKDGKWLPVKNITPYAVDKDQYNILMFKAVRTTALKLEVQLPVDNATDIHEWIVK